MFLALMPGFCHRYDKVMQRRDTILLLVLLLFSSCTQDDSFPVDSDGDRSVLLGINTLQATDISISKSVTRATATPDYPTGGSVGFFVKADVANGYKEINNRKGTYSTARKLWLPEAATPADSIWLNNHDADIAVYAPYDAAHTTAATLNLAACLRPADGSKDIWCKRFVANNQSKNLAVTLEHLYTRLTVVVSRDANYKSDANLTAFALKGNEIYPSATYKPFETVPYTNGPTTGVTPAVTAQTLNASTASTTYDLLLIPAALTGDITLTLTVDGKKMQVKAAKEKFTGNKLEAGKQYNVNLKLKPGKLEITSVSVVKWDALTEVSGGQVEFDEVKGIDLGLNFVIAPGNLIATKYVGEGGGYEYTFASEQGYYGGDGSLTDYFNWNTLEPTGSMAQTAWDDARDGCKLVGDGNWRTPTKAEYEALIAKGYVWASYTLKNGTAVDGAYFGTTTTPGVADQDKYLFLPATGYQYPNEGSVVTLGGSHGYYWARENDAVNNYGYSLYFYSGHVNVPSHRKTNGFPIRCVKKIPKPKPERAIDLGLDFYIADGNVIATKQADNTYIYSFATDQGYVEGDLSMVGFIWNDLDPESFVMHPSWDDARDPCLKVGDNKTWHTPTQDQHQKLVDLKEGHVWGPYLMKNGTTVNGRYFGTTVVPTEADQDKYVFLPAAGWNSKSGGTGGIGTDGLYWNTSIYFNGDGMSLRLTEDKLWITSWAPTSRISLRCVCEK